MSKKGEAFWREQISHWRKSGLSRRQYSISNNLNPSTLGCWIKKLENKPKSIKLASPEIEVSNHRDITINGNGYIIKIPTNVNPELLQIIIKGLK